MIEFPLFVACVALSISLTILLTYFISFIKFVRKSKNDEYIQNLNETVDKILEYKNTDMNTVVIDITDYQEHPRQDYCDLGPKIEHISDSYLEHLSDQNLIFMDDVKMWVKTNKR